MAGHRTFRVLNLASLPASNQKEKERSSPASIVIKYILNVVLDDCFIYNIIFRIYTTGCPLSKERGFYIAIYFNS